LSVKAKLSKHYLAALNSQQQERARSVIRGLSAKRTGDKVVREAHGDGISVRRGMIATGQGYVRVLADSAPVGDVVCEAVKRNMLGQKQGRDDDRMEDQQGQGQDGQDGQKGQQQGQQDGQGQQQQGQGQDQSGQDQQDGQDGDGQGQDDDGQGQEQDGQQDGQQDQQDDQQQQDQQQQQQDRDNQQDEDDDPYKRLRVELQRLREWASRDDAAEDDIVSYRAFNEGRKMLDAGLPVEAALHAYALTWEDAARREAAVPSYDPSRFNNGRKRKQGQAPVVNYVLALAKQRVPVQLVGPAGSGKGTIVSQVADELALPIRRVSLTGGASLGFLLGFPTPSGYVESGFVKSYRDGGVFLFDEMDAADPNMLLVVNEALANGILDHPFTGEVIHRSEDFVPFSAMNTWGTGGDADYTARERLDTATMDRWRMGRVFVDYDPKVEAAILPDGGQG
jgi:hypothetical protein